MYDEYLPDISSLCQQFKVDFKVEPDPSYQGNVVLKFGPWVYWSMYAGTKLTKADIFGISMQLAAYHPEHVLGKIPERFQLVPVPVGFMQR